MEQCMEALEFTTFLNTLSVAAANCLNDDELEIAAAAIVQIGDTLATIAVQRNFCKKCRSLYTPKK